MRAGVTWRDHARSVVDAVVATKPADLKAALFEAYPFGERRYWPYKIWCEEVARALGKPRAPKARKGTPARRNQEMASATLELPGLAPVPAGGNAGGGASATSALADAAADTTKVHDA